MIKRIDICHINLYRDDTKLIVGMSRILIANTDYTQVIVIFVNPYKGIEPDRILLSDGHYLNREGNRILYQKVDEVLKRLLGEANDK